MKPFGAAETRYDSVITDKTVDGTLDSAGLDKATIRHLGDMGWSLAQIAECVGCDRETILQVLRSAPSDPEPLLRPAPLNIRLTEDARRLRILLPADAAPASTAVLLARIHAHCADHHIDLALGEKELEDRMRTCVYGAWLTIGEAIPPTSPTDERVRVLTPLVIGTRRAREHDGRASLVRKGAVLAEIEAGRPGQPGKDLLGREIPPSSPRRASLPQGRNTAVSADGTRLLAECDGLAVLRRLLIEVAPRTIHEGDLTEADGVLRAEGDVVVTGSVGERASIVAAGDIDLWGAMHGATIESTGGNVVVHGAISGTELLPAVLKANQTITCDRVRHAALQAGTDIMVGSIAHNCRLELGGDLHVTEALDHALIDVRLNLGGGVVAPAAPPAPQAEAPRERRHSRIALTLPARIAAHGGRPLSFISCVIEDLSPGGARCRLAGPIPPELLESNRLAQLIFKLPGHEDQIVVIARIAHAAASDTIGVAFVQITERHADQVMRWHIESLRNAPTHSMGSLADRLRGRAAGER
jgi:hypothetical protein